MTELIGGHLGLQVWRTADGIVKIAGEPNLEANRAGLQNEARMLRLMEGTGFAPRLVPEGVGSVDVIGLLEEDVGPTLKNGAVVTDPVRFRRNCTHMLLALRERGIRHGDLTTVNLTLRTGDVPVALDWQESRLFDEPGPHKQFHSDSYLLWSRLAEAGLDEGRVMRRWMAILADLGGDVGTENLKDKRLLDLGCFEGDFCALAAADGMTAFGVDRDLDAIVRARARWLTYKNVSFAVADIIEPDHHTRFDVVLLFSAWPYILRTHGFERADRLLRDIVAQADVLYFETQLAGDGPGPDFFRTDADVGHYLGEFGAAAALVTIPVAGRDASRTVWRVRRA